MLGDIDLEISRCVRWSPGKLANAEVHEPAFLVDRVDFHGVKMVLNLAISPYTLGRRVNAADLSVPGADGGAVDRQTVLKLTRAWVLMEVYGSDW
jgi:hypothetical protein